MRVKVIALVLGVIMVSCGTGDKKEELKKLKKEYESIGIKISDLEKQIASGTDPKSDERIFQVNAEEIKSGPFNHFVEVQGKVDGEENVTVSSKTIGVVTNIYIKEGDVVKKGQVIALLDNAVLVRTLAELKTTQEYLNDLYEKQKKLWDQKIGSEIQFLTAKNNKEGMDKKMKTLEEQIDMYNITSPINGTVEEIPIKLGQSLAPGVTAFRIVNFSSVKITAEVAESYSVKIHTGDDVKISFPDNDEKISAKITFSSKYINPVNRTFLVEAKLEPGNIEYRANMIAIMEIADYSVKDAIIIPVNIIQADNNGKYIYLVEKSGNNYFAKKRIITTGRSYNGDIEILSGLKVGEKIVTTGFQNLEDGVKVAL